METGQRLGTFEIVERLGAGGMGEVYRARDTSLERDVAIKILPAAFAADPGRLDRLSREARLLATLNHPNIGAIYGIEAAGPVRALVLELVKGETLGARLRRKPLSPAEAVSAARQIMDAMDAAHESGIIHRDLKPDNIMLTERGSVKVLDFGLAKAEAPMAANVGSTLTAGPSAEGAILGTAAYMSPEQARGFPVDRRTDIWAFGCVLFEMLTGRRAFGGPTLSDTIAATLEKEPDWNALPPATAPGVRRLLRRCLEKDPRRRLRDIADGIVDLEEPPAGTAGPGTPARQRWLPWSVAAVSLALAAGLAWRLQSKPPDLLQESTLTPLTRDAGLTTMPALSKDGRLLAYASDRAGGGTLDIWVQQVAGGTPIRLTDDEADDTAPDFSPDGSRIVFQSDRGGGGVYEVSAFGGAPPRLVARGGRQPKFSPDGTRIAFWSGAWRGSASIPGTALFVLSLAGGDPQQLAPGFTAARAPVWAPDGRSLLFLGRSTDSESLADSFDWWWVRLEGSPPVRTGLFQDVALRLAEAAPSAWTREGVVFADQRDLWSVPVSVASGQVQGPPRRLTLSAGRYEAPAVSTDGRLVFASTLNVRAFERAPLGDADRPGPPVSVYADFAPDTGRPSETRDGTTIVFDRLVPNGFEIWTRSVRTGLEQAITRVDSPGTPSATISPDGVRIAYNFHRSDLDFGKGFVVETTRGVPFQVCEGCLIGGFLSDGRRLLVSTGGAIRIHDVVTGVAVDAVLANEGRLDRPHASPDDRWLAFRGNIPSGGKSYVVPLTPGHPARRDGWMPIEEPTTTGRPAGWSLDSRMAYLLLDTDGFRCLWGQRFNAGGRLDGTPVPVRHFHGSDWASLSTSFGNPISPEGFLYATMRRRGNIWSLVRQPSK